MVILMNLGVLSTRFCYEMFVLHPGLTAHCLDHLSCHYLDQKSCLQREDGVSSSTTCGAVTEAFSIRYKQ